MYQIFVLEHMISENIASIIGDVSFAEEIENFISRHKSDDPNKLRLKYSHLKNTDARLWRFTEFAILQIEARRKYLKKLPSFVTHTPPLLFPTLLSGEQASNESVARLHSEIISEISPNVQSLIDMTAGLGIDFMTIAAGMKNTISKATAVEMDADKALILNENLRRFNINNFQVINGESISVLQKVAESGATYDVIFADPARRDDSGGRLYDPAACSPDIVTHLPLLLKVSQNILIKNSPMVDIKECLRIFNNVSRVYIVSVRNECKEVLLHISREGVFEGISAIDIDAAGNVVLTDFGADILGKPYNTPYLTTGRLQEDINIGNAWLYEPSSSLMKTCEWGLIAQKFNLTQLSPNCHIFYSSDYVPDFQGRALKIIKILGVKDKKAIKGNRLNVVSRNHPERSGEIEKKYRLKSSDTDFLYAVTLQSETSNFAELPVKLIAELVNR